jgi:N-acetylglucosamine kinase-like BadF-type ATPase
LRRIARYFNGGQQKALQLSGWLIGIDGGGTRTRAALALADGGEPVTAEAGPCNWTTLTAADCLAAIDAAVAQLPSLAGGEPIEAVCLCSAGYYAPHHETLVRDALASRWPQAQLRLETDLVGAWAGALAAQPGIVLIAGTGSVAYGRFADGREARAGGWGPLFGDEGSGYWLACRGLEAVARALDERRPVTRIGEAFRALRPELGDQPERWLRELLRTQPSRKEVSDLAGGVVAAAADGDLVAGGLLRYATHELAHLLGAVAARLKAEPPLAWSWAGGLISHLPEVRERLNWQLGVWKFEPNMVEPQLSPEEGALLLAEASLGRDTLATFLRERPPRPVLEEAGP